MAYTVDYCDKYMDELLDKLGSDYFPMDIKFGRFVTATLDFIRENTTYLEATQEISDDIKPLLVSGKWMVMIPNSTTGYYEMAEPTDYLRLLSIEPYAKINGQLVKKFKKIDIVKEGQRRAYERDPHREATPAYPHIYRTANMFEINVGQDADRYDTAKISYIKQPTFGNINVGTSVLVNLPPIAVEKIMLKTTEALRFTTADETAASIYQFDQTFGKRRQ